jgi:hypothetical protein
VVRVDFGWLHVAGLNANRAVIRIESGYFHVRSQASGWRRYLWQQLKHLAVAWCDGCEVAAVEGQDDWGIESLSQSDD